ncbi:DMT family transporter [Pimelobacter simplex]|uniref:Permease of the drug/metabolite transporter (DMT) superfamily n=1 Tax=Nocardioides simplex TaxID=2045 RepID=A0A0A1DG32_NOCSI|nr:DMT family transporter [Pimelobacter simplex]AIY16291.2 Permease of the drug/metabolite transporter (DMT) superfamily [Pimelobacter simplex]
MTSTPARAALPSSPEAAPPRWQPVAAIAVTLVLWASAFVAIRHLGHEVTPGALSLGRLLIAAVVLSALLARAPRSRFTRTEVVLLVACGVAWFGIYNIALNDSERRIDAATAAMVVQVGPILIALLAALFLGERLTGWLLLGMVIAFGGVVVIGSATRGDGGSDLDGVLLALLAAVTYAIGVVCQKVLLRRLSGLEVTCYACWIGVVVCLPWLGDLGGVVREGDAGTLLLIAYLGLFPTAIAFLTWAFALRYTDAGKQSLTTFLVPAIATLMAWLLLDEVPPALAFVGGLLCIVGVLVTRRRPRAAAVPPGG